MGWFRKAPQPKPIRVTAEGLQTLLLAVYQSSAQLSAIGKGMPFRARPAFDDTRDWVVFLSRTQLAELVSSLPEKSVQEQFGAGASSEGDSVEID